MALAPPDNNPNPTAATSSKFLDLPTEIRLKIYKEVFDDHKVSVTIGDDFWNNLYERGEVRVKLLNPYQHPQALLSTSKKVRQESQSVAFKTSISIHIRYQCHRVLSHRMNSCDVKRLLQCIVVEDSWLRPVENEMQDFANLTHVDITIERVGYVPINCGRVVLSEEEYSEYALEGDYRRRAAESCFDWVLQSEVFQHRIQSGHLTLRAIFHTEFRPSPLSRYQEGLPGGLQLQVIFSQLSCIHTIFR